MQTNPYDKRNNTHFEGNPKRLLFFYANLERNPANKSQVLKKKNFRGVKKGTTKQARKSAIFAERMNVDDSVKIFSQIQFLPLGSGSQPAMLSGSVSSAML